MFFNITTYVSIIFYYKILKYILLIYYIYFLFIFFFFVFVLEKKRKKKLKFSLMDEILY